MRDSRRPILIICLIAGALALMPSSAIASTASISVGSLRYVGAAGEVNGVTVSRSGGDYVIDDPGIAITPMAPCVPVDADTATCPVTGVETINVDARDMDDVVTIGGSVTGIEGSSFFGVPIVLEGGAGDDTLNGAPSLRNQIWGHDEFNDGPGNDVLNGGSERDNLFGSEGNDALEGGAGFNQHIPGPGDDTVNGGPDGDSIRMGAQTDGADVLSGGGASDSVSYGERSGNVSVTTDGVANDGEAGEADNVMADIEQVQTGSGSDVVTMGAGNNSIEGNDGNDMLDGSAGDDTVEGGRGNDEVAGSDGDDIVFGNDGVDSVSGGAGDDTIAESGFDDEPDALSGGPGNDLLDRTDADAPLVITLDGVADDGEPGEGDNAMSDIEEVLGGDHDDVIVGNDSDNFLVGGGGEDTIGGGGGADGLIGGHINYSSGGQGGGSEVVDGGDVLDGGPGIDTLDGGTGADTLRSRDNGPDELGCGSSVDTVFADAADDPPASCDLVSHGIELAGKVAKVVGVGKKGKRAKGAALPKKAAIRVKARCPAIETGGCVAAFKIRSAGKLRVGKKRKRVTIAKGTKTVGTGKRKAVKLKLTKAGRKALDGRRKTTALGTARMTDANGDKVKTQRTLTVKR